MDSVQQKVLSAIREYNLIPDVTTGVKNVLLIGVSGGPDSVCLLHVLNGLKDSLGISLRVVHFNHMLRGSASDDDARYVVELCDSLEIPVIVGEGDVEAYRKEHRLSLEEAARVLRYDFCAEAACSVGTDCIVLGHTRDDQVETILMHLIRGTGLTGMRGMQPVTKWHLKGGKVLKVMRPLLEIARDDIDKYCREHGLKPRLDESNYSLEYMRNRVRHELIPSLRTYNKSVGEALLRTAEAAVDANDLFDIEVSKVWEQVVTEQPNGLLIDSTALLSCHPSIQRHLLRRAVLNVTGDLVDFQAVHVEKMMTALSKPAGKSIHLPRGLRFQVGYRTCLLSNGSLDSCPFPFIEEQHRLNVPGETLIPGWVVRANIGFPFHEQGGGFEVCFDLDAAGTDLVVRSRKPGDRFRPLGMKGTKSLQDFMVDAKIPRSWRDRVPLVCSSDTIIWVAGWRISDGVKVTSRTERVLRIELQKA